MKKSAFVNTIIELKHLISWKSFYLYKFVTWWTRIWDFHVISYSSSHLLITFVRLLSTFSTWLIWSCVFYFSETWGRFVFGKSTSWSYGCFEEEAGWLARHNLIYIIGMFYVNVYTRLYSLIFQRVALHISSLSPSRRTLFKFFIFHAKLQSTSLCDGEGCLIEGALFYSMVNLHWSFVNTRHEGCNILWE